MNVSEVISKIKSLTFETSDLVIRHVNVPNGSIHAVYIDGMVDLDQLEIGIIAPIIKAEGIKDPTLDGLYAVVSTGVAISEFDDLDRVVNFICSGECLLLIERAERYFVAEIRGYATRLPSEPPTSAVLKGPREGFTEDVKTNIVLLRRRFRTNKVVFKSLKVGRFTDTTVVLCYLEGVARSELVERVHKKISEIDIDGIIDSSYIAKFLEDRNYSIFRQIGTAEKPDIIAAKMLEGKLAIIVDGSPIVLTLPFVMLEGLHDAQDYFKRPVRTTMLRTMRVIAVFFAMLLPAAFVALQMYQFQMLPLKLMVTIINNISNIPFSPIIEMLLALLLFEVLGEASVRMPRYVGMAISVVGAIILGETAVNAGLLSPLTVLIIALSGIGLYAIPDEVGTFSVLRLFFVVIAGLLGMFGIILFGMAVVAYLVKFEIYGTPYLAPYAPIIVGDLKDGILKLSLKAQAKRPKTFKNYNKTRIING